MTVEVDNDRAVAAALPHRPIVDPDAEGSWRVEHRHAVTNRSTVARLVGIVEVREETGPPELLQAMPTMDCASQGRRLRGARGEGSWASLGRRQVWLGQ